MKKSKIIILIFINIIWAVSALIYDIPAIAEIPIYFWPFIVICPVYPALLALVWWKTYKKKKLNDYLLAFASLPSVIYFIGALIFYPTLMVINGFDWSDFGQIFWVAVYGLQGIYLLTNYSIKKSPILLVTIFLLTSFVIQYFTKTYDYLNFANVSASTLLGGYLVLALILILKNIFRKS